MFNEVSYWQRLRQDIPVNIIDLCQQQEKFRILRESVLLVVRGNVPWALPKITLFVKITIVSLKLYLRMKENYLKRELSF